MATKIQILIKNMKTFFAHFGLFLLIAVASLLVINLSYFFIVSSEKESLVMQQTSRANEDVSIIDFVLRTSISNSFNDLFVIKDSNEFNGFVNNPNATTQDDAEQLFFRIAQNKPEFLKIRYIDTSGDEVIAIDNRGDTPVILPQSSLVNIANRYYFIDTQSLVDDQLYMSYLDLDMVGDTVITPYVPVIRFAINVYDDSAQKTGTLIINFDAFYLLSVFGEYVESSDPDIQLALLSNHLLFQFAYQDQDEDNMVDADEYTLEIFNYDTLDRDADATILKNITISEDIKDKLMSEPDFIRLYAYMDVDQMIAAKGGVVLNHPIIMVLVDILAVGLLFGVGVILKNKSDDKVLLSANVYLSDNNRDAVLITDYKERITYMNPSFERRFGYRLEDVKNQFPYKLLGHDIDLKLNYFTPDEYLFDHLIWNRTKSGTYILNHLVIKPIRSLSGTFKYLIGVYSEPNPAITSPYHTTKDDAGNIYCSANFSVLAQLFKNHPMKVHSTTLFLVRIRDFVNYENDQPIDPEEQECTLCQYLAKTLSDDAFIAIPRFGYLMILLDLDLESQPVRYHIDRVTALINEYVFSLGVNRELSYLISVDVCESDEDTYATMIFHAFVAMEVLKTRRSEKYMLYQPQMSVDLNRDDAINQQIDYAFSHDEFYMNYQVQKRLEDNVTTGVEALLRWENHELGNIPPNEFIPKIESSHYVSSLSKMVIQKVIDDFTPYVDRLPEDFRIAVNMTSYDFFNTNIIDDIVATIENSVIPTKHFCFEITESNYLENTEHTNQIIRDLHKKSILVALDDFGKGFSALSSLKNIDVDKVKIDRIFIRDYPEKDDGTMLETIAHLVHTLGFTTLIEGTETKAQVDLAKQTGSQEHQGFFVSRPIRIREFVKQYLPDKSKAAK